MSQYKVQLSDMIQINSKAIRSKTSKKQNKLIKQKEKSQGSNVNINFYMNGGRELLYSLNTNATPYNNFTQPVYNNNNPNIEDIQTMLAKQRNIYINELENQLQNPYSEGDRNVLLKIQEDTDNIINILPGMIERGNNIEKLSKISALNIYKRTYDKLKGKGKPLQKEIDAYGKDLSELGDDILGDTNYVKSLQERVIEPSPIYVPTRPQPMEISNQLNRQEPIPPLNFSQRSTPLNTVFSRQNSDASKSDQFITDSSDFEEAMARAISNTPPTPPRDLEGMQKLTLDD